MARIATRNCSTGRREEGLAERKSSLARNESALIDR
jgi:hypothetical protein